MVHSTHLVFNNLHDHDTYIMPPTLSVFDYIGIMYILQ